MSESVEQTPVRILLVEDHALMRRGMKGQFALEAGFIEPHHAIELRGFRPEVGYSFSPGLFRSAIWLYFSDLKGNCSTGEPGHGLLDALTRIAV